MEGVKSEHREVEYAIVNWLRMEGSVIDCRIILHRFWNRFV
jgi:hypothetical protein